MIYLVKIKNKKYYSIIISNVSKNEIFFIDLTNIILVSI